MSIKLFKSIFLSVTLVAIYSCGADDDPQKSTTDPKASLSIGTIDTEFSNKLMGNVWLLGLQSDGKVYAQGSFKFKEEDSYGNHGRVNTDGTVDRSFVTTVGGSGYSLLIQDDDKIVAGGNGGVFRMNADGGKDESFDIDLEFTKKSTAYKIGSVFDVKQLLNGKLLVAGNFEYIDGQQMCYIIRLNSDGTLDDKFIPFEAALTRNDGSWYHGTVNSMIPLSDGKILIGGFFAPFVPGGSIGYSIIRLNENGDIDESFKKAFVADGQYFGSISKLVLQSDGKILVAGGFDKIRDKPANKVARLNADGSYDATFTASTDAAFYEIEDVELLEDGTILVASKNLVLGAGANLNILSPSGALKEEISLDGGAFDIVVLPDGDVLVAGEFDTVNELDIAGGLMKIKVKE